MNARERDLHHFGKHRVYEKIKERLLMFTETIGESQLRVREEWNNLCRKPTESLLEFEARWEEKQRYMKQAGPKRTEDEDYIDDIKKA